MFRKSIALMSAMLGVAANAFKGASVSETDEILARGRSLDRRGYQPPQGAPRAVARSTRYRIGYDRLGKIGKRSKASSAARQANVGGRQLHGQTGQWYISYCEADRQRQAQGFAS